MLRLVLAGSVAVLTVLMAVACGGGDSPTSTVAQDGSGGSEVTVAPTSTVARDSSSGSEATAAPTSTVARDSSSGSEATAAPTSTVARDSSSGSEVTVAEYAVWCAEKERSLQESDLTSGQAAKYLADIIDAFGDMSAPEELKALHDAFIAFLKASHDFVRMQDASEPFDSASFGNDEIDALADALFGVADTLDDETLSQLVDVGCIFS